MRRKLQVGKWLEIAFTLSNMNWDADDGLFNSYFLVKRTHIRSTLTMYWWHPVKFFSVRYLIGQLHRHWDRSCLFQIVCFHLCLCLSLFPPVSGPSVKSCECNSEIDPFQSGKKLRTISKVVIVMRRSNLTTTESSCVIIKRRSNWTIVWEHY